MFEFFGQNTLKIYIIHDFFRPLFQYDIMNPFGDTVLKIIGSVLISMLCIFIADILSQSNIFRYILFGERKINN